MAKAPKTDEQVGEIKFIQMKRDSDSYPEPHTATVHQDEVANYSIGGWEIDDADGSTTG